MSRQRLVLIAALGSALMLAGAFAFQHFGGLAPCKLCLWQRWPHGAAMLIGLVAAMMPLRVLSALGALVVLAGAAIAAYHVGVEQSWWQGPTGCASGSISGLSVQELLDQINAAPLVRCDEIPWSLAGVSMAGWNGIISVGLALVWLLSARGG